MIGLYKGRTKKKEWVHGNLIENFYKKGEYRIGYFGFDAGIRHTDYEIVDPSSICEAIPDLFDKRGERIYIGDILSNAEMCGEICFDKANLIFILKTTPQGNIALDAKTIHEYFRVVGNIHDLD